TCTTSIRHSSDLAQPGSSNSPQERQCLPGDIDGIVAMPAQFHVQAAGAADLVQRLDQRREIDLTLAEHQMLVDAAAHVLDVNIPEPIAPLRQEGATANVPGRDFFLAVQVANIEG